MAPDLPPIPLDPKTILHFAMIGLLTVLIATIPILMGYVALTRAGREALRMGVSNLRRNILRTALTMIGIVIGVGAVVSVVSMGDGAREMVTQEVAKTGGTSLIEIYKDEWDKQGGSTVTSRTRAGGRWGGRWRRNQAKPLTIHDYDNLKMFLPDVTAISAENDFSRGIQIQVGNREKNTALIGTTPDYDTTHGWFIQQGRFITDDDMEASAKVAVIGSNVAKDLFGGLNPIGLEIRARRAGGWRTLDMRLQVVGIMKEKGQTSTTEGWDDNVLMPLTTFAARVMGEDQVERMRVQASSVEKVPDVLAQAKSIIGRRHEDPAAFQYWTAQEEVATAEKLGTILKLLMGVIAGIALVVAGIGIMNIMLVSVTERTREIGLRKALGAKQRDILFQFLIETSVLSLMGGLLGTTLGVVLGKTSAGLLEKYVLEGNQWPSVISPTAVAVAVGVAFLVGVVSGVYPARRAASLAPVIALRSE